MSAAQNRFKPANAPTGGSPPLTGVGAPVGAPYDTHKPLRDPQPLLEKALRDWGGHSDLWVFGYASLIWRPEFEFAERRPARVHGWHRALKMWSRINRGTPECPGLVFGMLSGGSCQGMVFRIPKHDAQATLARLWKREMVMAVYDPKFLVCHTTHGPVRALAFTLSRKSPSHTGVLAQAEYRRIFEQSTGIYGTTLDYVQATLDELRRHNIRDRALERLLRSARPQDGPPPTGDLP